MSPPRASHPRFSRSADPARIELTDDDVDILRRVFRHRFIRSDDLYRLHSHRSPDRISRRLTHLYRNGYLDRPIAQVDRYRGGGSQPIVYGLAAAGARHLAQVEGVSIGSADWKGRNRSYTRENLDHTLAVTTFLVDLELASRRRGEINLITAEEILASAPVANSRMAPAARWPVPVAWHGHSSSVQIAPDALFGMRLALDDGQARRTFVLVEVDRGSMTIVPAREVREREAFLYRATILRKLLTYAESYRQGLHKEHLGIPTARVLLLTSSDARAAAMRQTAARFILGEGKIPAGLFLFGVLRPGSDPLDNQYLDAAGNPTRLLPQP